MRLRSCRVTAVFLMSIAMLCDVVDTRRTMTSCCALLIDIVAAPGLLPLDALG